MGARILPSRFSRVQLFVTPWTVARQAPLSMGILQARILEWVAMPSSRGSSRPRDQTHMSYISCIGRRVLYHWRQTGRPQVAGPLVVFRKVLLATVGMVDQREQKWTNWTTVGPWRGEEERIEFQEAKWTGCGRGSSMQPPFCPGRQGLYLVVDAIVVAAALLDGHAALAVTEEAGVTLATLGAALWALRGGAECRAAQGAGVCADLVVAVGGALHGCKEGVQVRALGVRDGGAQGLPLPCLCLPLPTLHSRQKDSVLQGSTWPPAAWQALT